jgi:hypothetical protein
MLCLKVNSGPVNMAIFVTGRKLYCFLRVLAMIFPIFFNSIARRIATFYDVKTATKTYHSYLPLTIYQPL